MRIHNNSFFLCASFVLLLAFSCTSDPKVEAGTLPSPDDKKITNALAETIAALPTAEEIAEQEALKEAEQEALKAEKKKEKEEAARKERRRKRREKRKKKAAEKAAAEKLALREAAEAVTNTVPLPPPAKTTTTIETSSQTVKSTVQEDLSDIDPNLLEVVLAKSNGGTPRIRFDSESYDFGRIIQGKEIDHQFEFTNTGSAPLVINNVEVTCGCTTPFYPFIPIEPGERGKISVHFSSKGRLGNQTPTITVYTNTDPGTFELHLKGIIDTEREGQ